MKPGFDIRQADSKVRPMLHTCHLARSRMVGVLSAWVLCIAVSGIFAVPVAAANEQFVGVAASNSVVTDLGTLGGSFSSPLDLNTRGQVVGVSVTAAEDGIRGFVWSGGVMRDIGSLGGPMAAANGINSSGQISGWSQLNRQAPPSIFNTSGVFCSDPFVPGQPRFACRAIIRDHGHLTDLGTLGGLNSSTGNRSVNDRGDVVGVAETTTPDLTGLPGAPQFHAVLWRGTGTGHVRAIDLGTLGGDPDSSATGVNNRGQVTGVSISNGATFTGETGRAFTWQQGQMTELPRLGGDFSGTAAINNRGDIVGASTLPGNQTTHATLWTRGRPIDLGTLPGDRFSEAADINDRGVIVGLSCGDAGCRAVRWDSRGLTDLNTTIAPAQQWALATAQAVNSRGQITGDGDHSGNSRAYLLATSGRDGH